MKESKTNKYTNSFLVLLCSHCSVFVISGKYNKKKRNESEDDCVRPCHGKWEKRFRKEFTNERMYRVDPWIVCGHNRDRFPRSERVVFLGSYNRSKTAKQSEGSVTHWGPVTKWLVNTLLRGGLTSLGLGNPFFDKLRKVASSNSHEMGWNKHTFLDNINRNRKFYDLYHSPHYFRIVSKLFRFAWKIFGIRQD